MYKCYECGEVFDGDYCPKCGSDYFERLCVVCGDADADNGICDACLDRYATDYEALEKASNKCGGDDRRIPELAASVLSDEEIKTALFQYIERNNVDCSAFIKDDRGWFADFLEEEKERGTQV